MTAKAAISRNTEVERLRRANAQLKAENTRLKSRLQKSGSQQLGTSGWRKVLIIIFATLATIALVLTNVLFWAGSTLVDNNKYTQTIRPLLQDETVQNAIATYTTDKLYENVDATHVVSEALPPKADFLAPTLTAQLKNSTDDALQKVLASDKFQKVWAQQSGKAHEKLIESIKKTDGDGVLNLNQVYTKLANNLEDTKLSFLADKQLPDNVGKITIIKAPQISKARALIDNIGWLKLVAIAVIVIFSAIAVWLAGNRRKMIAILGICFSASMLLLLVLLRLARTFIADDVTPAYQAAASHTVQIILHPLMLQTITILLVGLAIAGVAWLTGPYASAENFRNRFGVLLAGRVHESLFRGRESAFTSWVGAHKRTLQWTAVIVIAIIMTFVQLTPKAFLFYIFLILLSLFAIEAIAKPARQK